MESLLLLIGIAVDETPKLESNWQQAVQFRLRITKTSPRNTTTTITAKKYTALQNQYSTNRLPRGSKQGGLCTFGDWVAVNVEPQIVRGPQ